MDKTDYQGRVIPAVTRSDDVWETAVSPCFENNGLHFHAVDPISFRVALAARF